MPVASVPMKFPATTLPVVPASVIMTPLVLLPEITFPDPGVVPPMRLPLEFPPISTP